MSGLDGISDEFHATLMKWSGRTINFLSTLTSQQPGEAAGPVRNAAMPISAFKGVKGLAFIFRKKWGCICSYQRQVGFVTTKIVGADGTITWSPPLFVNGRLFGLGIIIGRQRSGMCLALLNDQAVQTALKGQKLFKLNADFLVDMDGAYLRATNIDSTSADDNVVTDASGNMLARYYRTNAMMIDFSMEFGYVQFTDSWNRVLYGEATAEEVLGAKVPPPTEFAGLMDMLNRLTEAAMPKPAFHRTRSNASQSALEKAARARLASSSNKSMDTGSIEPSSL